MAAIDPKNLTAQIDYEARGNPPSTRPASSVSNCFPGLELDLRNLWRRLLVGVELHEFLNLVVAVDAERPEVENLDNAVLTGLEIDGRELPVRSPTVTPGPTRAIERANAFAELTARAGDTVRCRFRPRPRVVETSSVGFGLQALLLFDANADTPWVTEPQPAPRAESITFDFGTPREVREILLRPAGGSLLSIFPRDFVWETSDDGIDFETLLEESDFAPVPDRFNALTTPLTVARFLRWRIRETRPFAFQAGQTGFLVAVGDIAFDVPEVAVDLEIRPLFDGPAPVWSEELAAPGELTQSLCSPWQNDFRDCGCFYWAASRPDFVNVEDSGRGHNWMDAARATDGDGRPLYLNDTIRHEDLFRAWESPELLRFVVGGRDAD
jgi:hypothetical protein